MIVLAATLVVLLVLVPALVLILPEAALFVAFVIGVQLAFGAALLYAGHALVKIAWHDHPALTVAAGAVLLSAALIGSARRFEVGGVEESSEHDDDQGGGGEPRRPPAPPEPSGPCGEHPDWDAFDEARRAWERPLTPA